MAEPATGAGLPTHPEAHDGPWKVEAAAEHSQWHSVSKEVQVGATGVGGSRVKVFVNIYENNKWPF